MSERIDQKTQVTSLPEGALIVILDPSQTEAAEKLRLLNPAAVWHPKLPTGAPVENPANATASTPDLSPATDPLSTPADATALRNDLASNTIPSLEARDAALATQVEALIADNASLRTQLNTLLARLRTTGGNGLLAD